MCNELIKIFKEPFGECNSAENTNTSVDLKTHWSPTKRNPQRWRVTCVEDSSPRRVKAECLWDRLIQAPLPYCFKSPFETKRPLVQQVRAIHSTDSGLGPGSERRHFSQNNRVGGGGDGRDRGAGNPQQLLNGFLWQYPRSVLQAGRGGGPGSR